MGTLKGAIQGAHISPIIKLYLELVFTSRCGTKHFNRVKDHHHTQGEISAYIPQGQSSLSLYPIKDREIMGQNTIPMEHHKVPPQRD